MANMRARGSMDVKILSVYFKFRARLTMELLLWAIRVLRPSHQWEVRPRLVSIQILPHDSRLAMGRYFTQPFAILQVQCIVHN